MIDKQIFEIFQLIFWMDGVKRSGYEMKMHTDARLPFPFRWTVSILFIKIYTIFILLRLWCSGFFLTTTWQPDVPFFFTLQFLVYSLSKLLDMIYVVVIATVDWLDFIFNRFNVHSAKEIYIHLTIWFWKRNKT